jgi:hypothetical protein
MEMHWFFNYGVWAVGGVTVIRPSVPPPSPRFPAYSRRFRIGISIYWFRCYICLFTGVQGRLAVVLPLCALSRIGALFFSPLPLPHFSLSCSHALRSNFFLRTLLSMLVMHSMHAHFVHVYDFRDHLLLCMCNPHLNSPSLDPSETLFSFLCFAGSWAAVLWSADRLFDGCL